MDWQALFERERARVDDGESRLEPGQLVRIGNAAYGAGLSLLMLGRDDEGRAWLDRAALRWRESWADATPTSWGRPIGVFKACLIAGRAEAAAEHARWALTLGCETAESPIGRYAAALALLVLERWPQAEKLAATLQGLDDFPTAVADALRAVAAGDRAAYAAAAEAVVRSFEERTEYLEDVAVADTALALQALAARRGIAAALGSAAVLPA